MAFIYTKPAVVDEQGAVVSPERQYRVQLEQVTIIGSQKQIHVTINKVALDTFEMTQEAYAIGGEDYEALRNKLTSGKSLLDEVGGAAWEYLILKHKKQITYGMEFWHPDLPDVDWQSVA